MDSTFDARKIAYELLDVCKEFMQEKGYLPPFGIVMEPAGRLTAVDLNFRSKEAKKHSMQRLRYLAEEVHAAGVVIITDATYRVFPREENDPTPVREDPDFKHFFKPDGEPRPCISMDMKFKGQTTTNVMVPYQKDRDGCIVFGSPEEGPVEFTGREPPLPGDDEDPMD